MLERVESWWRGFELCMLNAKNVRSCNKLLKFWIAGVTDEFSSETLILRKRLSSLYTKCLQFLPWPSLLFCTCYAGEMMIPCQVSTFSEFISRAFQLQGHLAQNKSVNAWKISNEVRKGLKTDYVPLNGAYWKGAYWMQKKSGVVISLKNEVPV